MVYYGPSRGCETCKRRRKKCDETRPSCLRCITAQRTCGGYEDGTNCMFRQYDGQDGDPVPFKSMARKCSLPVRVSGPGIDKPQEISDEKVEEFALRAFFYDYCIISTNHSLSRGYFDGLELMVQRLGWQSDLAKACKAVGFATHGTKLYRPGLMRKAEVFYYTLLGSLAKAIADPAFVKTTESLMIAVLLGLYEMIMAGDSYPGNHNAHARGVAAILQIENSPLELFGAIRSSHPIVRKNGIRNPGPFPTLYSDDASQSLNNLLLIFGSLWRQANALLADPLTGLDNLHQLKCEATALDQAFVRWEQARAEDFKPWEVGQVSGGQEAKLGVGYWPGRVDTYFDLYVAGVWNTYRAARLLLLDLVLKLSTILNDGHMHGSGYQETLRLVEDMVSSIPFHLAEDIQVFLRGLENGYGVGKKNVLATIEPGRPVGGLLLMHPLYVVSKLSIVPQQLREYLRDSLEWIAKHMAIGQASIFAKIPEIHEEYLADGCTLVWAGMLV
ncbi:hypothetical protein JMJ35_000883 [Cladonia borealis]|uniref:Zn(2)-C6 fungal-type domain-containing protein n=1 Tax=Cladonia borealis TaxID=184061 RepID=A0AA39R7J3_9LECA|nr:hypothetical protein JMJ35_000883 [Cladonia borealis]